MKIAAGITILSTLIWGITGNADNQSNPFKLKIASTETGKPDQYVSFSRVGASVFTLRVSDGNGAIWRLNYTGSGTGSGYLTTRIDYVGTVNPRLFGITVTPRLGSNIAELAMESSDLIYQSRLTEFIIDQQQRLTIDGGLDDTTMPVSPPKWQGGVRRWAVCKGLGYPIGEETTLFWILGNQKPQNPSCVPADLRVVPVQP